MSKNHSFLRIQHYLSNGFNGAGSIHIVLNCYSSPLANKMIIRLIKKDLYESLSYFQTIRVCIIMSW